VHISQLAAQVAVSLNGPEASAKSTPQGQLLVLGIFLLVVAIGIAYLRLRMRLGSREEESWRAFSEREGWVVTRDVAAPAAWFDDFRRLREMGLPTRTKSLQLSIRVAKAVRGRQHVAALCDVNVRFPWRFDTIHVSRTIFVVQLDGSWPRIDIRRRRRFAVVSPRRGVATSNAAFNRRYAVRCDRPEAVGALLTPQLIAAHLEHDCPSWTVAGAEARYVTKRKLSPETVGPGFDKLQTMVAWIPSGRRAQSF
jgi:hypothetical protein